MNRREVLTNLVLLTIIGCLAFLIYEAGNQELPDLEVATEQTDGSKPDTETSYDAKLADQKYPKFGGQPLFVAIFTPTPTPPPPTPTPTKTPDIQKALAPWVLIGTDPGEVTIEDKSKKEDNIFVIKVNETRPVQAENEVKNAKLIKVDHLADNPSATFELEGTSDKKILKLFSDGPM